MRAVLVLCFFLVFSACHNSVSKKSITLLDSLSNRIQEDPFNISLLNERAMFYVQNNNLDSAKQDLDKAYSVFKNDESILLNRGDVYFMMNETRVSKESWERCLKVNPNNIQCRIKLTNLLCAVHDSNCKSMIDTVGLLNDGIVPISLIVYLKELEEYDLAMYFLENIIDHGSELNRETLSLLAVIYSDTTSSNNFFNKDSASMYFDKLLNRYPDAFQVYYNLAMFKQNIFEYNEALTYYNSTLKIDSTNKNVYYNMGFCSMQLKEYEKGVNYFSKAINLDNSFLLAYHARAYLYELMSHSERAKLDWKNCLMLNPSYIPALEGLNK